MLACVLFQAADVLCSLGTLAAVAGQAEMQVPLPVGAYGGPASATSFGQTGAAYSYGGQSFGFGRPRGRGGGHSTTHSASHGSGVYADDDDDVDDDHHGDGEEDDGYGDDGDYSYDYSYDHRHSSGFDYDDHYHTYDDATYDASHLVVTSAGRGRRGAGGAVAVTPRRRGGRGSRGNGSGPGSAARAGSSLRNPAAAKSRGGGVNGAGGARGTKRRSDSFSNVTSGSAGSKGAAGTPSKPRRKHRSKTDAEPRTFSSSYFGVSWHKSSQRWAVQIRHDGKRIHVGYYTHEVDAAKAYDKVAKKLRGPETRTNFDHAGDLLPNPSKPAAATPHVARAPRGGPKSPPGSRAMAAPSRSRWRGRPSNKELLQAHVPAASPGYRQTRRGRKSKVAQPLPHAETALAAALAMADASEPGSSPSSGSDMHDSHSEAESKPLAPPAAPDMRKKQRKVNKFFNQTRVQDYANFLQLPVQERNVPILRR